MDHHGVTFYRKQDRAIDAMMREGNKILIKYGNFEFGTVKDNDQFAKLILETPPDDRIYYEVLRGPQKLFADIDGEFQFLNYSKPEQVVPMILEYLQKEIDNFDPKKMLWLNSSTNEKLSIHFVYPEIVFENHTQQSNFWKKAVLELEKTKHESNVIFERQDKAFTSRPLIDIQVYSANRAMRAVYCHKKGSNRVLVPCTYTDGIFKQITKPVDITDYLINSESPNFTFTKDVSYHNRILTREYIEKIIKKHVPNTELIGIKGNLFKLKTVGTRICPIGGEENESDGCYVVWKRDGLYYGCHDAGCQGHMKKILEIDSTKTKTAETRAKINFYDVHHGESYPMAKLTKSLLEGKLVYAGKHFYYYNEKTGHWKQDNDWIMEFISEKVVPYYQEQKREHFTGMQDIDIRDYERAVKFTNNVVRKLLDSNGQKKVRENLKAIVKDDDFHKKMDADPDLFGFDDGIYSLKEGKIVTGPQYFVSKSCGHKFSEIIQADTSEITKILKEIFVDREQYQFMFDLMTSMLNGHPNQFFYAWIGNSANGKGLLTNILNEMFGEDYANIFNANAVLVKDDGNEIAKLGGKRFVASDEVEAIDLNKVKILTGGGMLECRQIYSVSNKFTPAYTMAVSFNHPPMITKVDDALKRRFRLIEFKSSFVLEPKGELQFKRNPEYEQKSVQRRLAQGLLKILLERYKVTGGEVPKYEMGVEWLLKQDPLIKFVEENYRIIENPRNDQLTTNRELFQRFRKSKIWQDFTPANRRYWSEKMCHKTLVEHQQYNDIFKERHGNKRNCYLGLIDIDEPDTEVENCLL